MSRFFIIHLTKLVKRSNNYQPKLKAVVVIHALHSKST